MPDIRFRCPGCQRKLSVAESYAGQKVLCPSCNTKMLIPSVSSIPAHDESQKTPTIPTPESAPAPVDVQALQTENRKLSDKVSNLGKLESENQRLMT